MYCTGGIRCEKASAVMLNAGFSDVKQLEGGVLGYFEECGGSHWNGDCFVFDQRVAIDHKLSETTIEMCFKCREPLSVEEQKSTIISLASIVPIASRATPECMTNPYTLNRLIEVLMLHQRT